MRTLFVLVSRTTDVARLVRFMFLVVQLFELHLVSPHDLILKSISIPPTSASASMISSPSPSVDISMERLRESCEVLSASEMP